MRRIADLYPGVAKTDARDAFVIANAALICLVRHRCDVLYTMLATKPTTGTPGSVPAPAAA